MAKYKLTYFNGKGRAENARMLFTVAGVEFEDNRLDFGEWAKVKAETPFGVLPRLNVDGKSIAMSSAIANYLAREFGLYGKTNMESTRIDTTCNALIDIMDLLYKYMFAKDDAKEECLTKFSEKAECYGAALEAFLKENGEGDGYFSGSGLTLADIAFFNAFSEMKKLKPDVLDKTPKLKALMDRVAANEKIAKWIETRPQSQF